jgi:hypothetical protein
VRISREAIARILTQLYTAIAMNVADVEDVLDEEIDVKNLIDTGRSKKGVEESFEKTTKNHFNKFLI